jgi:hypothetical protein
MIEKNAAGLNSLRIDNVDIRNVEIGGDFNERNLRFHAWAF